MKGKTLTLGGMAILAVLCSVLANNAFQAPPKDPDSINQSQKGQNKKRAFWVHRREPGTANPAMNPRPARDPDASGALAVAIRVTKNGSEVEARLWRYKLYDHASGKYDDRRDMILAKCEPKGLANGNSFDNSRERELYTLKELDTATGQPTGKTVGYMTFYKGKPRGKGNGNGTGNPNRKPTRTIFRWHAAYARDLRNEGGAGDRDTSVLDDCDDPPEDDPMEEEDLTLDNPNVEIPPDMLEDPLNP